MAAGIIAAVVFGAAFFFFIPRTVNIAKHHKTDSIAASLPEASQRLLPQANGTLCAEKHPPPRAIAVMLAGDTVTRPLSGIGRADIVVEMPVVTGSITRFMAIFQCTDAAEIGSIRSARDDFIPLAAGFDAIYAHWGGSHFALDELRRGVIDNIDALRNPYGAYFRKTGVSAPHNGFSSLERLNTAAEKLGYRLVSQFLGYTAAQKGSLHNDGARALRLTIGHSGAYRVEWHYDAEKGRYLRWRGGTPEIDAITQKQVEAGTVAVMRSTSRQIEGQYNDVRVTGEGEATVFRLGEAVSGIWRKEAQPLSSPLRFLDADGKEISFSPGALWIEIVEKTTPVIIE